MRSAPPRQPSPSSTIPFGSISQAQIRQPIACRAHDRRGASVSSSTITLAGGEVPDWMASETSAQRGWFHGSAGRRLANVGDIRHRARDASALATFALTIAACGLSASPAHAKTWYAKACGDTVVKGSYTLRIAVNKASSGDVVSMAQLPASCSTIALVAGEIVVPQGTLTIRGPTDRTVTVSASNAGRVLYHNGGGLLALHDFEVAYGKTSGSGGCIYSNNAVYLDHMIASICHADISGGAVAAHGAQLRNSLVTSSSAGESGGGVAVLGAADAYFYASTITANQAKTGGGLWTSGKVHLDHVTVSQNQATASGGGVYAGGGLVASYGTIDGNMAGSSGGGVFSAAAASLTHGSITSNLAYASGGGMLSQGTVTVTLATIAGNVAYAGAGGVRSQSDFNSIYAVIEDNHGSSAGGVAADGASVLVHTTISGNGNATACGGGLLGAGPITASYGFFQANQAQSGAGVCGNKSMLLSSSTVANNLSGDGGAVRVAGAPNYTPTLTLQNATISGNRSGQAGASGVEVEDGMADIRNSTIALNRGGGVQFSGAGDVKIRSSIVANNCAAYSITCFDISVPFNGSKSMSGGNNLVGTVSAASGLQFIQGDPRLAPLGWHGGSVPTLALMSQSAAIDLGSNPVPLANDARGTGYPRAVAFGPDIGAYERQPDDDEIFAAGFYYFTEFPGD